MKAILTVRCPKVSSNVSVWSLDISVKELSDLKGKVIFVSQSEYEVMRYSEAYRKFFANNEIVSL